VLLFDDEKILELLLFAVSSIFNCGKKQTPDDAQSLNERKPVLTHPI
jgi:hypothetical protein